MQTLYLLLGAALAIGGGLVASLALDEAKGWLGRIPFLLLRAARRRLPVDVRGVLYEEWLAELDFKMKEESDRPITRLVLGIRFSVGLIRYGRRVAAVMKPIVEGGSAEPTGKFEELHGAKLIDGPQPSELIARLNGGEEIAGHRVPVASNVFESTQEVDAWIDQIKRTHSDLTFVTGAVSFWGGGWKVTAYRDGASKWVVPE